MNMLELSLKVLIDVFIVIARLASICIAWFYWPSTSTLHNSVQVSETMMAHDT